MNAARRARHKAQPDRRKHDHQSREARTLTTVDEGGKVRTTVTPCPWCRPTGKETR